MLKIFRLLNIITILVVGGVFFVRRQNRGRVLQKSFEKLGPAFIKLGQMLSSREDIIGDEVATDLRKLQDSLPPFAFSEVKKIIKKEFDKNIEELFAQFYKEPIAAASIAQVHKAITHDGKEVAVKILRPKIERHFRKDINLFYFVANILNRFKKYKRLKLPAIVELLEKTVKKELDLRIEAAFATKLKENCSGDEEVYIPQIYWNLTRKSVLVTEWVDAIRIDDNKIIDKLPISREDIAKNLAVTFFNQVYRDGFFHADLHAGNVFVRNDGKIILVDFGIMGILSKETRLFVAKILLGFLQRDYKFVADVHFEAGYVEGDDQAREEFEIACRAIGEPIFGLDAKEISIARLLELLFKITADFNMQTRPELLLLQKSLVMVEGIGMKLYNNVNLWLLADDWIKQWYEDNLGMKAKFVELNEQVQRLLSDLPYKLKKLNDLLDEIGKK